MSTGAALNRHGSKQDYQTPPEFIEAVERRFGPLVLDLAASAKNTVAPYYVPPRTDSLVVSWGGLRKRGNWWLNPPFGTIAPWAEKCAAHRLRPGWTLFLIPAAVGSNWFAEHVDGQAHVMRLRPRLTFVGETHPYPKDLLLAAYGFGVAGVECWEWLRRRQRR